MFFSLDFKTKESEKDVVSDLRIPAVNRDVNLNTSDTKAANCEAPGRRRKLSAELIMSAIQKKASTITTNWRAQKSKVSPEPSLSDQTSNLSENNVTPDIGQIVAPPDRRKLNLPVQKLTTIPSVDYHSDSDSDTPSPKDISSPASPTSPGGRGILKKVSNVELPNLELLHSPASEEETPPQVIPLVTVNNSPSRMVKFDMPSFDSHTSEEQNQAEEAAGLISEQTLKEERAVSEMGKLLEQLQRLEVNISGDHEVMEKFSMERIVLERRKWLEVLRKSLSNVLRLQNALKLSEGIFILILCM